MFSRLKQQWRHFRASQPGHRFRAINERHRGAGMARRWWIRALFWVAGLLLIVVGAFFAVAPGPASIFIFPGAILIACESHAVARGLDWLDVKLAPLFSYLGRTWRRLPHAAQLIVKILVAGGSIAAIVFGFVLMR